MPDLTDISLKIKNYKSFGETPQGFDRILPINIIIGKNNAGKSALLDAVSFAIAKSRTVMPNLHNSGNVPELLITQSTDSDAIERTFQVNTSGGHIGGNHFSYGAQWINSRITTSCSLTNNDISFAEIDPPFDKDRIASEYGPTLAQNLHRPFADLSVSRLFADRDIRPEPEGSPALQPNGEGATNLIRYCLHDADADAGPLIKQHVLTALNFIFEGETVFKDILVKVRNNVWEVYLVEDVKASNEIPLSNSGSGLKTIILVLLQLLVVPSLISKTSAAQHLFLLEEVENNLHPGLLRNLLSFIRQYAHDKAATFFITTHSSVTIDLFDRDIDAQIVHVKHDKTSSIVSWTQSYSDKQGIIDDLDVRSSDILQANAVIWVEGPSDRTYINHWIKLRSLGQLREGEHYQCVFYGGRLLARISADPENADEVNILKVNRHAILLMDSDVIVPGDTVNATKNRMQAEVEAVGGKVWITHGKEIENYLPKRLLESYFGIDATNHRFAKTTKIDSFLNAIKAKAGDTFLKKKVFYAEEFIEKFDLEMLEADPDLLNEVDDVCKALRKWNGVQVPRV